MPKFGMPMSSCQTQIHGENNMSYGATVGASAATSNLIKLKKKQTIFTPVLNKSYVHCDFSRCFIDYLKNAYEFKCL